MENQKLPHYHSFDQALRELFGNAVSLTGKQRVAGGDINEAYKLFLSDGTHIFMKQNARKDDAFFSAEIAGLTAIARTNTIGTPKLLCSGTQEGDGGSFLLMEFIEKRERIAGYWEIFARQLSDMHKKDTSIFLKEGCFGFPQDNFIGSKNQKNTVCESWISFFREYRLLPQFESAAAYFSSAERKKADRLLERLDDFLIEPAHPSLLHGDLWAGNFITGNDGRAWLIDPAAYVGCAEADLAMTELFGGFSAEFYAAYSEAYGRMPDYESRRDLYNLYHLLNHLNLFGGSYLGAVLRVIGKYV